MPPGIPPDAPNSAVSVGTQGQYIMSSSNLGGNCALMRQFLLAVRLKYSWVGEQRIPVSWIAFELGLSGCPNQLPR